MPTAAASVPLAIASARGTPPNRIGVVSEQRSGISIRPRRSRHHRAADEREEPQEEARTRERDQPPEHDMDQPPEPAHGYTDGHSPHANGSKTAQERMIHNMTNQDTLY